jgi:hypothetical protein
MSTPQLGRSMLDLAMLHTAHVSEGTRMFASGSICITVRCDEPAQEQIKEIDIAIGQLTALKKALAGMESAPSATK